MSPSPIRFQRDQSLACMILSLCTASAVFLSVFGRGDPLAIAGARNAVAIHEGLLRDATGALRQNEAALSSIRAALKASEPSRQR
jgi:hypothetical protein